MEKVLPQPYSALEESDCSAHSAHTRCVHPSCSECEGFGQREVGAVDNVI